MKPNPRHRCALVCAVLITLFSIFSFRLVYLQVIKHDEYAGLAAEKHVYKQIIYAERGAILDANNEVLAHNIPVETVVADATHLNDAQGVVDLVSGELGIVPEQLAKKLGNGRRYIVIKREVPEAVARTLSEKLRERIWNALPGAPYAGVLSALAVGDQRSIDSPQWQLFARTGVSHLMSISGLHITLFAWAAAAI